MERNVSSEKRRADEFIDCIVTADVLAHRQQLPGGVKESGGVQTASVPEDRLSVPQFVGQLRNHGRLDPWYTASGRGAARIAQTIDGRFPAHAATGGHIKVSAGEVGRDVFGKPYRNRAPVVRGDIRNLVRVFQDAFG